ncbi:hypothetical protein FTUN_2455 [Frigoriglobus tundricola]|uniref:Uncharacterized protein n=1 Tax=Frigoriglobus tundricola TaxID=2774151 RepID=A0A6M5YLF5_9BACT|nr:hypothetical protein FTUN_2455 [Frigoriglobus tundricola]
MLVGEAARVGDSVRLGRDRVRPATLHALSVAKTRHTKSI